MLENALPVKSRQPLGEEAIAASLRESPPGDAG